MLHLSFITEHKVLRYFQEQKKSHNSPLKDESHMDSGRTRQRIKDPTAIPLPSTSQKHCLQIKEEYDLQAFK